MGLMGAAALGIALGLFPGLLTDVTQEPVNSLLGLFDVEGETGGR